MKNLVLLSIAMLLAVTAANAQNDKQTEGEKFKEAIKNLPDDLLKQPEAEVDTNANKITNDNLYIEVPPLWKEKGTLSIIDFRLQKCDAEPLVSTFPLGDKKLVQGLTINLNTVKKTAADKKAQVVADIQKHLTAFYKEAGKTVTKEELNTQTNAMLVSNEAFTTTQGKVGELFFMHDIQTQQAGFVALLLVPGAAANTVTFVYINYFHYVYETSFPEDVLEWRTFVYAEDQQTYIDFTKKIMKSLVIK